MNPDPRAVTFETKCWEKDWQKVLQPRSLHKKIGLNGFDFVKRIVYINNMNEASQSQAVELAESLVTRSVLTSYVVVHEHEEEALGFFGLTRKELGDGYYYSIAELVGVYLCDTPYLLHFSSDSMLTSSLPWIYKALDVMEHDSSLKVANPTWNEQYEEAEEESLEETPDWYIGRGFSDQCYLVRTSDFRAKIYQEKHPLSRRYPSYGGELFEKRVSSWMYNHHYHRLTYKHGSYMHPRY
jgi:hypothetical protein